MFRHARACKWQPARQSSRIPGAGHRRTPWRRRCRHGEGRPIGAGQPRLERPRNDRRFPPRGVKGVASYGWPPYKWGGSPRWLTLLTTTTLLSQRARPSLLWLGPCLESRIGSGLARIPRVGCDNRGGAPTAARSCLAVHERRFPERARLPGDRVFADIRSRAGRQWLY